MAKKNNTDKLVLDLINLAKTKKEDITKAEKPNWKTNCSFKYNPESSAAINIQVATDINVLVSILGFLYTQESNFNKASEDVGADAKFTWGGSTVAEWKDDIKTRITKIQINKKKAELEEVEQRLEKLVSPELKAQIELAQITQLLNK